MIAHADDKARAERLERLRRNLVMDIKQGKAVPSDFTEDRPWSVCFRLLAQDEGFWNEQVRHPATSWLASGGKGIPMASSEALATAHFPGLSEGTKRRVWDSWRKMTEGDKPTGTSAKPNDDEFKQIEKSWRDSEAPPVLVKARAVDPRAKAKELDVISRETKFVSRGPRIVVHVQV